MNETHPWRTFSIFISSTFADMQAERDYLKHFVFPRVEEDLCKKRIRLEIVDLRWGVDTTSVNEAEREATVLKVCLDEIRRCQPFFIGLLGDRYGWVPPEERMLAASIGQKLVLPTKNKSVTALEMEFGVLASTEQLTRSVFYFRERLPYEAFSSKKAALYCDDFDPNLSATEKEARKAGLSALKDAIFSHYNQSNQPNKVKSYTASWDNEKQQITGLESWGEQVFADILSECAGHAVDTWNQIPHNPFEQQQALLDAFIESHTHITTIITPDGEEKVETFCGREKLLGELRQFLLSSGKGNSGIVMTGESGTGKSAIFAMVYKMMQHEDCLVLAHSAGISNDARSIAGLLKSWNRQLYIFLQMPEEIEVDKEIDESLQNLMLLSREQQKNGIEKLQERFSELFNFASLKTQVVLLVDALDRFEPTERACYMTWLPKVFPENARLLVTAVSGTEKNVLEYHKYLGARNLDQFTPEEAEGMLKSLCKRQHKSLSSSIQKMLLSKMRSDGLPAICSPLWLSLAVSILMSIDADDFEQISGRPGSGGNQIEGYLREMAEDFHPLPGELFLELVEKAMRIFGTFFSLTVFNGIACSRAGLRESDLEALINKIPGERWDLLRFANLRRWFNNHLAEQGDDHQWNLVHSILRNTLKERLTTENINNLHVAISSHLLSLPVSDTLRISETMYHLMQLEDRKSAIVYYTSKLDEIALMHATKVLAEIVAQDEVGLEAVASLPSLLIDDEANFPVLLNRFVYELNDFLEVEGNLDQRLFLLNKLHALSKESFVCKQTVNIFKYDISSLDGRLGCIYEAKGDSGKAIEHFTFSLNAVKELSEASPNLMYLNEALIIAYENISRIFDRIGEIKKSFEFIGYAYQSIKKLDASYHNNKFKKRHEAFIYSEIGDRHFDFGQFNDAITNYKDSVAIAKNLYENDNTNVIIKSSLSLYYLKLGVVYNKIANFDKALELFNLSNSLAEELFQTYPNDSYIKQSLGNSYSRLGSIYKRIGNITKAREFIVLEHSLIYSLWEANPSHMELKMDLANTFEKLGDILESSGDIKSATEAYLAGIEMKRSIYKYDKKDLKFKQQLWNSCYNLGQFYVRIRDFGQALKYSRISISLAYELKDSNIIELKEYSNNLAESLSQLGNIQIQLGAFKKALKVYDFCIKPCKTIYEKNPKDVTNMEDLAYLYEKLGYLYDFKFQILKGNQYYLNAKKLYIELSEQTKLTKYNDDVLRTSLYSNLWIQIGILPFNWYMRIIPLLYYKIRYLCNKGKIKLWDKHLTIYE